MIAELMAPIEIPATQSGCRSGLGQRFINTRLIGAERAAALKQQRDLFERRAPLRHSKPPVSVALRRNKPTALASLFASRRRRWMQPAPKATVGLVAPAF
jgi:hypothetical protein